LSAPSRGLVEGGPFVVAVGGGHGLARSLGAARAYAGRITAVVSVADDGGSSGRLREALRIPAPGDVRRCLVALLPGPSPLGDALEHRFGAGELEGHAFGNLLIAALAEGSGDFVGAVAEACRLLGTIGAVIPSSAVPVTLLAKAGDAELEGQVRIMAASGISRVALDPPGVTAPPEVLRAIAEADQIIIGPGSLYPSVLAALAPAGVAEAIAKGPGQRVYVANLREQVPETAGYDVGRHVEALAAHGVEVDVVLADTAGIALGEIPPGPEVILGPLANASGMVHDEALLARALAELAAAVVAHGGQSE